MKPRWATALLVGLVVLTANLPGLRQVLSPSPLEADSDTRAMLAAMRETGGWAGWRRWIEGDWFLQNGFYRPVTCFSLLLDYSLYGEAGWGYRLTNWVLALLTAIAYLLVTQRLAQQWLKELSCPQGVWFFSLTAALALSLQQSNALDFIQRISAWWLILAGFLATVWMSGASQAIQQGTFWRQHGWQLWLGAGAFFWGWNRLVFGDFERLFVWVPSRTALLSTALAMWSCYFLLRWGERGQARHLIATAILYLGAVGAYEQPLTLVAPVTALAWVMRREWQWRGWAGAAAMTAIAAAYLLLRWHLLPHELSGYQQQQLRSAPHLGVMHWSFQIVPILSHLQYWRTVGFDPYLFFSREAWDTLVVDLAFVGVFTAAWRYWRWVGWWLLWQAATLLPMSLLHPFEHYYYLPQAAPNAIDCLLIWYGWKRLIQTAGTFEHR